MTPDASAPAPTADVDATGGSADAGAPTPNADSAAAATGAAASEAARAVPATGVYASAEDALLVYVEGKRTRDPERLWSVMPDAARKVVSDTLVRTRSAPADQLAKAGLTPADLEAMTPRAFFDFLVNRAPPPAPTPPVSALTTIPDGDTRARVTYKLGAQACDANTVKDGEGWKVEVARCAP